MASPTMKRPVAFISKSVAPMGGLEADMLKCIRAICERGHPVHVLYGFKQPGSDEALAGCDVAWHHIPMPKRPPVIGQMMLYSGLRKKMAALKKEHPEMLTITLERLPVGDIHIGAAPQSLWSAARKRMGLSPLSQPFYRYWLKRMDRLVQQHPGHTLLIFSERDRQALMDEGVPAQRIERVMIPTDTERFTPDDTGQRDYITIVGANPKLKGVDRALAAWPEVSKAHPELRLRIVSKGWKVRKLVERLALPRVELAPFIPDVERYYHSSRLLLAPSMFETWGNVVPEALACGVPVVATSDVPASELIATPDNGRIINSNADNRAVAEAILESLELPMNAEMLQQRHESVVQHMTKIPNLVEWLAEKADGA